MVRATFDGPDCELIATVGATEPYQGWVSTGYLELTPAYVVSASCPANLVESRWQIDFAPQDSADASSISFSISGSDMAA